MLNHHRLWRRKQYPTKPNLQRSIARHSCSRMGFCLTALMVLLASDRIAAQVDDLNAPFATSNRNPFIQVYGLPAAQGAQLVSNGKMSGGLQFELANNFTNDDRSSEQVFIDGETHRTQLQLRFGVSPNWELGLDMAYLQHKGGSLDSVIEDWHDLWGLPDGDRPGHAQDQLQYEYQLGSQGAGIDSDRSGLGDVSLSAAYRFSNTSTRQWALRTAVKLPTGDADDLLGSGSTDVSMGLHLSDQSLMADYRLSFHASAGALYLGSSDDLGGSDVLVQSQQNWVAYGSSTFSWQALADVSFKLQLDGHTAFYDSGMAELGDDSVQLIIGGTVRLGSRWLLDLAVSEDIVVDTAPDVVFVIGLKATEW